MTEIPLGGSVVRLLLDGGARTVVRKQATEREAALYRAGLDRTLTGAPALLEWQGAYLILEDVGDDFPNLSEPAAVTAVYTHLGQMHRRFSGRPLPLALAAPLSAAEVSEALAAFPRLAPEAAAALTAGPVTLVHGDYHRWNLALDGGGRVRVLDWEHAAAAPPVWDLLLLAPDEPGWDGVPHGPLAELALRVYHEAGPLAARAWNDFLRLQRLARLAAAARLARRYAARAVAAATPGAAAAIGGMAEQQQRRAEAIARTL